MRTYLRKHRPDLSARVFEMIHTLSSDPDFRRDWLRGAKIIWDDPSLAMLEWVDPVSGDWSPDPPEAAALSEPIRHSSRFGDVFAILANLLPDENDLMEQFRLYLVHNLIFEQIDCEELVLKNGHHLYRNILFSITSARNWKNSRKNFPRHPGAVSPSSLTIFTIPNCSRMNLTLPSLIDSTFVLPLTSTGQRCP